MTNIDWAKILASDPQTFREIMGGISKKAYKNTDLTSRERYNQLVNDDFSELNFIETFNYLWGDKTIAQMTAKTGITQNVIYLIKRGKRPASMEDMEKIALAFNKDPSYFLEYRIGKVLESINSYLEQSPETATAWFTKVKQTKGIVIK